MPPRTIALGLTLLTLSYTVGAATTELPPAAPLVPELADVQAQSHEMLSTECFQQSRNTIGDSSSCDGLIAQAQSQPVAPALLAAAYSNRGLITGRRASAAADVEALQTALQDHQRAAELAPERTEPLMNQANVLLSLGRLPDALVLYDKIASLQGVAATAHRHIALHNRAIAYRALGDLERAYADLMEARRSPAPAASTPSDPLLPIIGQ